MNVGARDNDKLQSYIRPSLDVELNWLLSVKPQFRLRLG